MIHNFYLFTLLKKFKWHVIFFFLILLLSVYFFEIDLLDVIPRRKK